MAQISWQSIPVSAERLAAIEAGDVHCIRSPVLPKPRLGGDQQWIFGHQRWERDELMVSQCNTGIEIAWECPLINRGRIMFTRRDRPSAKPVIAAFRACHICRLRYDIATSDDEAAPGGDLLPEGFFTVPEYAADWDLDWGKTASAWAKNPFVWRIIFRVLTREIDGESGRSHAGNWRACTQPRKRVKAGQGKRHPWRDR